MIMVHYLDTYTFVWIWTGHACGHRAISYELDYYTAIKCGAPRLVATDVVVDDDDDGVAAARLQHQSNKRNRIYGRRLLV